MLRDCYGEELRDVEVEVIHGGIQTGETMEKLRQASRDDTVIWVYMDSNQRLSADSR